MDFVGLFDVITSSIILLFGMMLQSSVGLKLNIKISMSIFLYFWHTLFALVYIYYVNSNGGDAVDYYLRSLNNLRDFSVGTIAIDWITSFFSSFLGFSFVACSLVFNIFGCIGMLILYSSIKPTSLLSSKTMQYLALGIILLPSLSFWSSAIGKDSISFLSVCLALWSSIDFSRRKYAMFFSILLMLLVRPHIAAILIAALSIATLWSHKMPIIKKLWVFVLSLLGASLVIPYALVYVGLTDTITASVIGGYIEARQGQNLDGGSSVDIASMILPMKVFTFIFRPLPFEAHNVSALLASIDNVILLLLFTFSFNKIFKSSHDSVNRVFLWVFTLTCLLVLSLTTANLGIAVRQKWMFLPCLIYLSLSAIYIHSKKQKIIYKS